MTGLNGSGVVTRARDPFGPPLPGTNTVRELERQCPNGVKRLLMGMERTGRLDDTNPAILNWMQQHGLTQMMQQGPNAGHIALSLDGQRVWRSLNQRMAGKS